MSPTIQFLAYRPPPLESGTYHLKVEQTVSIDQTPVYGTELFLSVVGERFTLSPSAVHAVFPPEGSTGNYSNVLPHVALNRGTFPWERSAGDTLPWIALLLFDEEEIKTGKVIQKTIPLGEYKEPLKIDKVNPPSLELEIGQDPKDKIVVIDVEQSLLKSLMPTEETLRCLAHVRRNECEKTELAVVVGNRLPKRNSGSTAHLVSLEKRFNEHYEFNFQDAKDGDYIRLVSLKSWRFACAPEEIEGETFDALLQGLEVIDPVPDIADNLPENIKVAVTTCYSRRYTLLPHRMRNGEFTYSWYHGPLTTQDVQPAFLSEKQTLPQTGDELMRYHADLGLFDTAYAAAFELGRVLALDSPAFAAAVQRWKHQRLTRLHAQAQKSNTLITESFALSSGEPDEVWDRAAIIQWLEDTTQLKNVPFNYLVPDERMLTPNTTNAAAGGLLFFKLDLHWLESLLLGAFSIGPSLYCEVDKEEEMARAVKELMEPRLSVKSGLMVRSPLVTGYPDLSVDGYKQTDDKSEIACKSLRCERLSPEVLFCLFDGALTRVRLYLKAEGLHYGLDTPQDNIICIDTINDAIESRFKGGSPPIPINSATFGKWMVNVPASRSFSLTAKS